MCSGVCMCGGCMCVVVCACVVCDCQRWGTELQRGREVLSCWHGRI